MNPSDPTKKYFDVAKPKAGAPGTAPSLKGQKHQMININETEKPQEESGPKSSTEDDTQAFDDTLIDPDEAFEPTKSSSALSHPELNVPDHVDVEEEAEKPNDNKKLEDDETTEESEDLPFVNPLPGTVDEEIEERAKEEAAEKQTEEVAKDDSKSTEEPDPIKEDKTESDESTIQETGAEEKPKSEQAPEKDDDESAAKKSEHQPITPSDQFVTSDALPEVEPETKADVTEDMQDPKIFDTKEYYVPIGNTHHSHGGLKMAFAFGILCAVIVVGAVLYYMYKIGK